MIHRSLLFTSRDWLQVNETKTIFFSGNDFLFIISHIFGTVLVPITSSQENYPQGQEYYNKS